MYLHPDTYVNELMEVSVFKVPQHRGVVQVGQVGHVVDFVKFWRIHLQNLLFFQILFLERFREEETICISIRNEKMYFIVKRVKNCTFFIALRSIDKQRERESFIFVSNYYCSLLFFEVE